MAASFLYGDTGGSLNQEKGAFPYTYGKPESVGVKETSRAPRYSAATALKETF